MLAVQGDVLAIQFVAKHKTLADCMETGAMIKKQAPDHTLFCVAEVPTGTSI